VETQRRVEDQRRQEEEVRRRQQQEKFQTLSPPSVKRPHSRSQPQSQLAPRSILKFEEVEQKSESVRERKSESENTEIRNWINSTLEKTKNSGRFFLEAYSIIEKGYQTIQKAWSIVTQQQNPSPHIISKMTLLLQQEFNGIEESLMNAREIVKEVTQYSNEISSRGLEKDYEIAKKILNLVDGMKEKLKEMLAMVAKSREIIGNLNNV